jgi:hypothetical protein
VGKRRNEGENERKWERYIGREVRTWRNKRINRKMGGRKFRQEKVRKPVVRMKGIGNETRTARNRGK